MLKLASTTSLERISKAERFESTSPSPPSLTSPPPESTVSSSFLPSLSHSSKLAGFRTPSDDSFHLCFNHSGYQATRVFVLLSSSHSNETRLLELTSFPSLPFFPFQTRTPVEEEEDDPTIDTTEETDSMTGDLGTTTEGLIIEGTTEITGILETIETRGILTDEGRTGSEFSLPSPYYPLRR